MLDVNRTIMLVDQTVLCVLPLAVDHHDDTRKL